MRLRYILLTGILFCFISNSNAQRVKRKGVTPIDVTKKKKATFSFTLEQFSGKWQEISRKDKTDEPVAIADTIFLNFIDRDNVDTREGNKPNMKGAVAIDPPGNILLAAADVYTILSVSKEQLVLYDQEKYIHTFKKTDQFWYETFGKLSVKQEEFKYPVSVYLENIMGKWMVYRRQAKPGAINPPTNIIKYLKLLEKTSEETATGEVTFYQSEKTATVTCTIKVNNAGIEITGGGYTWNLFVYKADKNELVFGEAEVLLYYAKPI